MDRRARLAMRLRQRLLRRGSPRFEMAVIVIATITVTVAGFVAQRTQPAADSIGDLWQAG